MFNSFFLIIMLLAFKHTHLSSDLDVFPCIPLHLLSSCTFRAFFDKPPCPTSLNIVLYVGITAVSQCLTCITPCVSLYCRYHRSITVSDLYHSLCIIVLQVSPQCQCLTCITPCVSLYCRYHRSITVSDLYHSLCIILLQVPLQYHSVWPVSLPLYHCIAGITAVSQCLTCITPCVSLYCRYYRSITVSDLYHSLCIILLQVPLQYHSVWPVSLPVYHSIVGTTAVSQWPVSLPVYHCIAGTITVSDLYHSMCIIVLQVPPQYHSVWPVSLPVYHCIAGTITVAQCLTCITPCVSLYCRYHRSIKVSDLYHSLCIIVLQVPPQYHSVWPVSLPVYHCIAGTITVAQCLTCITPCVSLYCRYHRSITVSDLYHSLCIIVLQVSPQYHSVWPVSLPVYHCIAGTIAVSQCLICITPCVSLYCRYHRSITVSDLYLSLCIIVLQVSPQYHSVWSVSLPVYHCIVGTIAVSQCLICITPCVSLYCRYHRSITVPDLYHSLCIILLQVPPQYHSVWPVSLPVYHCIAGTTAVSQCLTCITPCVSLYCRYHRSITVSDLYHSLCIIVL